MPLRYKVAKEHKAEIPAEQLPFYVERDNALFLDVEGVCEISVMAGFRNNNSEMMRLLGVKTPEDAIAKLTTLKDIDPAEVAGLRTKIADYEAGKHPKLDELLAGRTEAMKTEHAKVVKSKDDELTATKAKLQKLMIDDALTASAIKKGVLDSAVEDVRLRGGRCFKLDGDEVVCLGADGKPRYGKGGKLMSIDEWMDETAETAKHLFKPNSGGGAGGGAGGGNKGGFSGPNPYAPKTRNLTQQAVLERTNPNLAASLKQAAESE